ncbi:MAG: hypothetical protein FWH31_06935 [Streptococcaceae bacterium]|nr:hypothetical protein [Streptococcaceae bacterium]
MIDKDIEEKLKTLRELYLDKRSENDDDESTPELDAFTSLTTEEKENKLLSHIDMISKKLIHLDEKLGQLRSKKASKTEISELKYYIDVVKNKKSILEQKLDYIQSGEFDAARKDKIKRQLTELELKRCKALLTKKDYSKIEEKIAAKKEQIKKRPK